MKIIIIVTIIIKGCSGSRQQEMWFLHRDQRFWVRSILSGISYYLQLLRIWTFAPFSLQKQKVLDLKPMCFSVTMMGQSLRTEPASLTSGVIIIILFILVIVSIIIATLVTVALPIITIITSPSSSSSSGLEEKGQSLLCWTLLIWCVQASIK